MRKTGIFFVSAFLILIIGFAQDYKGKGRVNGFVYDEGGRPLEGVIVRLYYVDSRSGYEVKTDASGKWSGVWLRSGAWDIDFEKPGYLPQRISVKIKESDKNPDIQITMQKAEGQTVSEEFKSLITEGSRLYEEGNWEGSLQVFTGILDRFPEADIVKKSIGDIHFKLEQYEQAIGFYQEVLEKNPDDLETMISIGNCFGNMGQGEKAMEWYSKIAIEEIQDVNVLYNIGTDFYERSLFEKALEYYIRAVELKSDFLDALYQLGLTYSTLENYEKAGEVFKLYLERDSDSERAGQVRGFLDFLKKK
jgi:tetratricopeptide (TPR) repeat protein